MKTILSLAALTLLVSMMAFGQNTEGTSAQALVVVTLGGGDLLVTAGDGEWGPLAPGTTYTITADGSITPPQADAEFIVPQNPYWEISSTDAGGAAVQVTFALPPYFLPTDLGPGPRMPYSALANSAGWFPEGTVEAGAIYTPFDPHVPYTLYLDADGLGVIGLGGVVTIPAIPGGDLSSEYTGTFILTGAFTGF